MPRARAAYGAPGQAPHLVLHAVSLPPLLLQEVKLLLQEPLETTSLPSADVDRALLLLMGVGRKLVWVWHSIHVALMCLLLHVVLVDTLRVRWGVSGGCVKHIRAAAVATVAVVILHHVGLGACGVDRLKHVLPSIPCYILSPPNFVNPTRRFIQQGRVVHELRIWYLHVRVVHSIILVLHNSGEVLSLFLLLYRCMGGLLCLCTTCSWWWRGGG